jgi:hypothetical protein
MSLSRFFLNRSNHLLGQPNYMKLPQLGLITSDCSNLIGWRPRARSGPGFLEVRLIAATRRLIATLSVTQAALARFIC